MAILGAAYALTAVDNGGGHSSWANPTNGVSLASGNAFAKAQVNNVNTPTNKLYTKYYNFNIPNFGTIQGFVVEANAGSVLCNFGAQLVNNGSLVGSHKSTTITSAPAQYYSFGGSTDLWGTTWASSDVNNYQFGVAIDAGFNGHNGTINVNGIRMTVYYQGGMTARVSLPGYEALTDNNLDHYALYADVDNVLIKEFSRGNINISAGSGAMGTGTITHNLGYVPFFAVYGFGTFASANFGSTPLDVGWGWVGNYPSLQPAPWFWAQADTTNLYIVNGNPSLGSLTIPFDYYIFYDNLSGTSGTFTSSNQGLAISRAGFWAGSDTNPNNYIFHSDLNTFKIIQEGLGTINYTGTTGYYDVIQNIGTPASAHALFIKPPDGYTTFISGFTPSYSHDGSWIFNSSFIGGTPTGTNIRINVQQGPASAQTLYVKYYIFEPVL